jgi:hypothetical protein
VASTAAVFAGLLGPCVEQWGWKAVRAGILQRLQEPTGKQPLFVVAKVHNTTVFAIILKQLIAARCAAGGAPING